jgi:predicted acyl esterase
LHFIVGRHDLPFYYSHSAALQLSFFNTFLKDDDVDGWKTGKQPRVKLCLREGDAGVDNPERELNFPTREETDWPIPDTQYTKYFLTENGKLSMTPGPGKKAFSYDALHG